MVCQNQSIDDSDAELARDLRVLVRERLVAGDSDAEVIDYVVSRYGEFVLLKPRFNVRNALLWGAPVLLLLAGGVFMLRAARRRDGRNVAALTAEENAALDEVLRRDAVVSPDARFSRLWIDANSPWRHCLRKSAPSLKASDDSTSSG